MVAASLGAARNRETPRSRGTRQCMSSIGQGRPAAGVRECFSAILPAKCPGKSHSRPQPLASSERDHDCLVEERSALFDACGDVACIASELLNPVASLKSESRMARSSSGQDTALSRLVHGFDSRTRCFFITPRKRHNLTKSPRTGVKIIIMSAIPPELAELRAHRNTSATNAAIVTP
jgi:hypothetical protein